MKIRSFVKKVIKSFYLYDALITINSLSTKISNFNKSRIKKILDIFKLVSKFSFIMVFEKDELLRETMILRKILHKARIKNRSMEFFYYPDFFILPLFSSRKKENLHKYKIGNLTPNYQKVLDKGIIGIKKEIIRNLDIEVSDQKRKFLVSLLNICDSIEVYIKRAQKFFSSKNPEISKLLQKVPLYPAETFKEALQSILIINALFWTAGYSLINLGRLDQILYKYYVKDIQKGIINKSIALKLIKEFLRLLHIDYKFKSNVLSGDTGQVILLGGKGRDGKDVSNELTFIFMTAAKELKLPDPKIVLRIHKNTPENVWEEAFNLLMTGLGYPLFCNDDIIIPSLIKFGYDEQDAYNYQVSACWEPLIPGKSLDQNNVYNLNLLEPLELLLIKNKETKKDSSLFDNYSEKLEEHVKEVVSFLNKIEFEPALLFSLFTDNCIDKGKDISEGGAVYNNFGILIVGLANVVDSLLNLEYLLSKGIISNLGEAREIIKNNFEGYEFLYELVRNMPTHFGSDRDDYALQMSNKIISTINEVLKTTTNSLGGRYKFGLSSPSFISSGNLTLASFDGRKRGEPLGVHISPIKNGIELIRLLNYSSSLDYSKAFNGCVTDIILDEQYIKLYRDKFLSLLKTFFEKGGMQLQANVVNYKVLKEAVKDPNAFPNLIVRVWGFSAYFKDLPKEYQQLILERYKIYAGDTSNN